MAGDVGEGFFEIEFVGRCEAQLLGEIAHLRAARRRLDVEPAGMGVEGSLRRSDCAAGEETIGIGKDINRLDVIECAAEELGNGFVVEAELHKKIGGDLLLQCAAEQFSL